MKLGNDVFMCATWPQELKSPDRVNFAMVPGTGGITVPAGKMVQLQVQLNPGELWHRAYGAHPGQAYRLMFHDDNGEGRELALMFPPDPRQGYPFAVGLLCGMVLMMVLMMIYIFRNS